MKRVNKNPLLKKIFRKKVAPVCGLPLKLEYGDHNRPCTCHGPGDDWYKITGEVKHNRTAGFELISDACNCGHSRTDHFRDNLNCMFSTDDETWACGCHEYRPA